MGQRLVVTIKSQDKPKMKIYYHWSGYTMSTFEELQKLWDIIAPLKKAGKSTDEILLGIIHGLEGNVNEAMKKWLQEMYPDGKYDRCCHGGIDGGKDSDEWKYITSLYPNEHFLEEVDRNEGLVAMSDKGMDDLQSWSEGDAWIDLDTETYGHNINWPYHGKEDYISRLAYDRYGAESDEETVDELAQQFDDMAIYDGDGSELFSGACADLRKNADALFDVVGNSSYEFRDTNDTVWELVG